MKRLADIALVFMFGLPAAGAGEMRTLDVEYRHGVISINMEALLQVAHTDVERTLNDYRNLHLLLPVVKQSSIIPTDDAHSTRVHSRVEGCVWIICSKLEHVMDVQVDDQGEHHGETVIELSDFDSGSAHWRLSEEGEATVVSLEAELEPQVWVPPLFGPRVLKRKIRRQFERGLERLEQAALTQ